jgi:hypothetical protein
LLVAHVEVQDVSAIWLDTNSERWVE